MAIHGVANETGASLAIWVAVVAQTAERADEARRAPLRFVSAG